MKFRIVPRTPSELQVGLAYVGIGSLGFAIALFFPQMLSFVPPCLFRRWTGFPCPICGATHAGIHLAHFQLGSAVLANPLFFTLFLALALWGANTLAGLIFKRNLSISLSKRERSILRRVILPLLLLNWLYLIMTTR